MPHYVEIKEGARGTWAVVVDGKDIAASVSAIDLRVHGAGHPALLTFDMTECAAFHGQADIKISDLSAEVLVSLGWTPPKAS